MSPHPNSSPLKNTRIRMLAGSACFTEIAMLAKKEWRDTHLENLIDERFAQEKDYTGIYRKMLTGNVPTDAVCTRIQKKLGGGNIKFWRDHPFWGLLYNNHDSSYYVNQALRSVKGRITHSIWSLPPNNNESIYSTRLETTIESVKEVAQYQNFRALITLTAWATEARNNNTLRPNFQCAYHSRKIFAAAVCATPHLFIRWPYLIEIYTKLIWTKPKSDVSEPWFNIQLDDLITEIYTKEKNCRNNNSTLPPKHLFRRINKNHPLI